MATEVDWDSFGGKESGGGSRGKVRYIKFDDGSSHEVRPIGKVVEFAKFFIKNPDGNRSIVVDINYANEAADILMKHSGQEHKYSHRFAVNVIDRSDGQVKIMEGGRQIFKYLGAWAKRHKASGPGCNAGGDWSIEATGKGLNREYMTQYMGQAPVSNEEKQRIKDNGDVYALKDVYKMMPLDTIVERAFGERKSGNASSEPEPNSAPQQAQSAVNDDDDIDW